MTDPLDPAIDMSQLPEDEPTGRPPILGTWFAQITVRAGGYSIVAPTNSMIESAIKMGLSEVLENSGIEGVVTSKITRTDA